MTVRLTLLRRAASAWLQPSNSRLRRNSVATLSIAEPVESPDALAEERDRLVAAARSFADACLAESTRRAYWSDLEDFSLWCHYHPPSEPLPAMPETISLSLADLAKRGLAVSTIHRQLAALPLAHRTAGHEPSPTEDVMVRQVMRGIRPSVHR